MRLAAAVAIVLSVLLVPFAYAQCPTVPPPTVTLVSGVNPSCSINTVVLEASAGYASYVWDDGSTSRTRTFTPTSSGTKSLWVVGKDANGCASGARYYSVFTGGLTYTDISLQNGPERICSGAVGGTMRVTDYGGGTITHQWGWQQSYDATTSTPIPGATDVTYQVKASDLPGDGRYWFSVVSTPQCGSPRRDVFGPFDIGDVLPAPSIGYSWDLCPEGWGHTQVFLTYESYLWSIENGEFFDYDGEGVGVDDDPTKPEVGYRPTGTDPVILTLTVTGGGGTCSRTDSVTTSVHDTPPPTLYGPDVICSSATRAVVQDYNNESRQRQWSITNGIIEYIRGTGDEAIWVTPDGSGLPISVTVTSTPYLNCTSTDTHVIQVQDVVPIDISFPYNSPAAACVGGTGTAIASSSHSSWTWTATNATILSGQGTYEITYRPTGGPVTLAVSGTGGPESCPGAGSISFEPPTPTPPQLRPLTANVCPYGKGFIALDNDWQYASYTVSVTNGSYDTTYGPGTTPIPYVANGSGPVTITVRGTDHNGCVNVGSVTVPLAADLPPPTITSGEPTVCNGRQVNAWINGAYSFQWSVTNATIVGSSTSNLVTFSPDGTGPVTVSAVVRDENGCVGRSEKVLPLTVLPVPEILTSTPGACAGSVGRASLAANSYTTLQWSVTNATIVGGQGTSAIDFIANGAGDVVISLAARPWSGCWSSATTTVSLDGVTTPPSGTITASSSEVCPGAPAVASLSGGPYANVTWTATNATISSGQGTSDITFLPDGNGNVTLHARVRAGSCDFDMQDVIVPVKAMPAPTVVRVAGSLCGNATSTVGTAQTYDTYAWTIQDGTILGAANAQNVEFSATGSAPVLLTLTVTKDGCTRVANYSETPGPALAPVIDFTYPTRCPGQVVRAQIENLPYAPESILWTFEHGTARSAVDRDSFFFEPDGSGPAVVTVHVRMPNGCEATVSKPLPFSGGDVAPVITTERPNVCYYGVNVATAPAGYSMYQWNVDGGTIVSGHGTNRIVFRSYRQPGQSVELYLRADGSTCRFDVTKSVPSTVDGGPYPEIQLLQPDMCANGTNEATLAGAYDGITWTVDNGYIVAGQGTNHIVFASDPYLQPVVRVAVMNGYCGGEIDTVAVPLRGDPPAIVLGAADMCPYSSNTATITGTYEGISWNVTGGELLSGQGTNSITFSSNNPASGPTVQVTVLANGCETWSAPVTVPFRQNTPPAITLGTPDMCPYGTNSASVAGTWEYISWNVLGGQIDSGQGTNNITFRSYGTNEPPRVSYSIYHQGCELRTEPVPVPYRTYDAPAITLGTPDICTYGTNSASITGTWDYISWNVMGGQIESGQGTNNITFRAYGTNEPPRVSYSIYHQGCEVRTDPVTVPYRQYTPPAITLGTPDICTYGTNSASITGSWDYISWNVMGGQIESGQGTNNITFRSYGTNEPPRVSYSIYHQGCEVRTDPVTVPYRQYTPPAITLATPDICPNGTNSASITGTWDYISWNVMGGQIESGQGTNSITFRSYGTNEAPRVSYSIYHQGCEVRTDPVTVPYRQYTAPAITLATPDICPNGTNSASITGTWDNVSWSVTGGEIVSGVGTNNIIFRASGSEAPRVFVTIFHQGCEVRPDPVTVPFRELAPPAITVEAAETCSAGTNAASIPQEYATYLWTIENGSIVEGEGTNRVVFQPNGTAAVVLHVTVMSADGCNAPSASVTVPVTAANATLTASGPTTFCAGGSVTLTAPAAASYLWSNGATTQSITVSATGVFDVAMTTAGGCTITSEPIAVTVHEAPVATIAASGPTTFCEGGSVTLTAPGGQTSVLWSNGATTPSITVTESGSYSVTVTNASGCSATSAATTVTVHPNPSTPAITASGPTTFCAGGSVTLTAPGGQTSVLWSNGATTPSITVSESGSYSVTVTNASGCSATSATTAVTVNPAPATPAITASGPTTFCEGGSVTLTAPGGQTSVLWSNGATTESITVTESGSYSVTVTNASGCSATSAATTVTVNAKPAAPAITPSGATTFCEGGSVTLTAPLSASYLWSTGATTRAITVTAGGDYSVTVSNASGCSATSAAVGVTVHPRPVATITASSPTTFCAGGSTTLSAPDGAYTYLWSNGATARELTVTASGSYSVTVTGAGGCSATSAPVSVSVNTPLKPTITPSRSTTFCGGETVTLMTSQSAGSTYLWSNGVTTANNSVTVGGTYTVTVTNSSGCSATSDPITLVRNERPTATVTGGGAYCTSGSATIRATLTGAGPWTITWSDGVTQSGLTEAFAERIVSPTATTTYRVVSITDTLCAGNSTGQAVVTVNTPPAPPTIQTSGSTTICEGQSVTLAAPGYGGWSYLWSTGATTASISAYTSGSYTVTMTDPNGCSSTSQAVVVTVIPKPPATITADGPTTFCSGSSVNLSAPAGYTYLWSNGATTQSIHVTTSGNYSVTVRNASNCAATSAPTTVTVNPTATTPTIQVVGSTTFCAGGSVTLNAPSGYSSYLWSNGATTRSITVTTSGSYSVSAAFSNGCPSTSAPTVVTVNDKPPVPAITPSGPTTFCAGGSVTLTAPDGYSYLWSNGATTQSINVAAGGSYSVTVQNATGCSTASAPTTVTVSAAVATPSITAGGPTTFCAGGSVTLTAPDGYSYLWSNGETTRSITATASGSYSVTVTSASGCSATSAATTVTVNAAPPVPSITASGPTTFCAGGSVTLTAPDGYTYLWSNGSSARSISVSTSGSYGVTVTNASGCSSASAPATVTVHAAAATPSITASGPTTFCPGGSVTLTASGGQSFVWSNGATTQSIDVSAPGSYSVTVTNANGCSATSAPTAVTVRPLPTAQVMASSTTLCAAGVVTLTATPATSYLWSNGATTQSISVNAAGTYSVTVSDGFCSNSSAPVTIVSETTTVAIAASDNQLCAGEAVTLTASVSGTAASYQWYGIGGTALPNETGSSLTVTPATGTSEYFVRITTPTGCVVQSNTVLVDVSQPAATISASGPTTFCTGGSVTLTASGGQSFVWSNGATTQSISVSASGSYSVTVTNANGCSATSAATTVTVHPAASTPTITASGPTTFCAGGSVTLTASGGQSFVWSNGATTQSIDVTTSGSYSVTVTNANGCSATSAPTTVTVNARPATPAIGTSGPTTFCTGGSVTLSAPAASSYLWSNGATSPSISVTASGTFTVTVTNASGCSATSAPVTVTVNAKPATPSVTAGGPTTFCAGSSVSLTAPAGFTYLWSNGATTQSISATASGSYSVTVTNASGCSATSAATSVTVTPATTITSHPQSRTITRNSTTKLTVLATGTGTVTYQWYNGTSGNTNSPIVGASQFEYTTPRLGKGTYSYWVRVSSNCGTADSTTVVVTVP